MRSMQVELRKKPIEDKTPPPVIFFPMSQTMYRRCKRKVFFCVFCFFLNKMHFNVFYFCNVFVNKIVDNINVSVSKLFTWNVGRTLVLLLEWCDRTPQFSGLSPVRRVIGLHHCIHITRTYDSVTWYSGCMIAFQAKFDSICNIIMHEIIFRY